MTVAHPVIGYWAGSLIHKTKWTPWIAALGGFLPDLLSAFNLGIVILFQLFGWAPSSLFVTLANVTKTYHFTSHILLFPLLFSLLLLSPRIRQSWFAPFWLGWILHIVVDMISHAPAYMPSYLWPFASTSFGGIFDHEALGFSTSLLIESYAMLVMIICLNIILQKKNPAT